MIHEVTKKEYRDTFPTNPHIYISDEFLDLVNYKVEHEIRLMQDDKTQIGIIAGIKNESLVSPYSAPFGGFHYTHEYISYDVINEFIGNLKEYVKTHGLKAIEITLPPDIYQTCMNAKLVKAMLDNGYKLNKPDFTNWVNIAEFDGKWVSKKAANICRKAVNNRLTFHHVEDKPSQQKAYDIIYRNRIEQNREIHMSLECILEVNSIIPIDFFLIKDSEGENSGAGIFYRGHQDIAQGIFMGDEMEKRQLGVINFLVMNIYDFYKQQNFKYIDLGTSSLAGEPNIGLIRFKEIHNCATSLRYSFSWSAE